MINKKLRAIYEAKLAGYRQIMDRNDEEDIGLDGPWLMHCEEEYYLASEKKILFVGKEGGTAAGWATDDIDAQIEGHRVFAYSTNKKNQPTYKSPRTPFWMALWEFSNTINPSLANQPCFLHTNVSRYSMDGDPLRPEDFGWIHETVNLLPEEVKAAAPDIVIFFSGPNFDDYIRLQFGDDLRFEIATEYIDKWRIARVVHPNLPENTFRTYHPKVLRKDKWHFLQLIAALSMGYDPDALLKKLVTEMELIARELDMEMDCFPGETVFGSADSCIWFCRPVWQFVCIGFGFDIALGEFFYGICRKKLSAGVPEKIVAILTERFGPGDGSGDAVWAWWKKHTWVWGIETFQAIQTGEFAKDLKEIVLQLAEKIGGVEEI